MEQAEDVVPARTKRVYRSKAEKRRIVELAFHPGMSVARVAQSEGVNANQVFQWRREYRNGQLAETGESAALMLPVIVDTTSCDARVESPAPIFPETAAPTGAIHIELPGLATISIEHGADHTLLQMILESLRK
jgi:transposase